MAGIQDYSTCANAISNIAGINSAEGCPAANVNNLIRQLASDVLVAGAHAELMSATASMSLAGQPAGVIDITGSASVVHLGTARFGYRKWMLWKGSSTLVNSSNLICQGGANITTATNDVSFAISLGAGNWVLLHQKGDGTAVSASPTGGVRAVTGTTDTILAADRGKLVTYSNAGAIAVTVPQATGSFTTPYIVDIENLGVGAVTLTPTTSTVDGAATLVLQQHQGVKLSSDGTNWFTQRGGAGLTIGFSANKNGSDQGSITANVETKITFGTEEWDTGGYYDAAQSRFTPPAGLYLFTARAAFTGGVVDQQNAFVVLYKSGTAWRYGPAAPASGTGTIAPGLSLLVRVNGTDYYELYGAANGTGDKTVSGLATNTYFQATRVG